MKASDKIKPLRRYAIKKGSFLFDGLYYSSQEARDNMAQSQGKTWKQLLRKGYRVCRVNVVVMIPEKNIGKGHNQYV